LVVGVLLALALIGSLGLSVVALCLSSLTRLRFVRVLLLAGLAGVLSLACAGAIAFGDELVSSPYQVRDPDMRVALVGLACFVLAVAAFALAILCARLAHAEENRSTPLRVLSTAVLLLALAWLRAVSVQVGEVEVLTYGGAALVLAIPCWASVFATEAEALGRRARLRVRATRSSRSRARHSCRGADGARCCSACRSRWWSAPCSGSRSTRWAQTQSA
jgi:hypothetical protein